MSESILRLHDIYKKRGYTIRTGLSPWHFKSNAYRNLPISYVFTNKTKLSVGGGIAFTEFFLFSMLCERLAPKNILIIGNGFGLSSVLLSLLNPSAKVVAIDAGIEGIDNDEGTRLTREIAQQEKLNLKIVHGFSPVDVPDVVKIHFDGPIDMVFIDGMHTNNQQTADFNACWEQGRERCVYLFHDVLNHQMTNSFNAICGAHPEMRGEILWRTPSGMGVLSPPESASDVFDLFTQKPEMIEITKREVWIEWLIPYRLIMFILPVRVIRWLRRVVYG